MLEWIISSSVLIAVVIALRFILKGKISPRLQYALWALVLVRLLLPFSIGSSSLSVMNPVENSSAYQEITAPESGTVTVITPGNTRPGQTNPAPPLSGTQTPTVTVPGTTPSAGQTAPDQPAAPPAQGAPAQRVNESIDIWDILRLVWLSGSLLLGAWFALTNLRFSLKLKQSRTPYASTYKLPVYMCGAVDTPCLFGFFRPAVYLTENAAFDERTLRHAVEHEVTHYYHKDHIWAVLRCVCLAVHWFNPLVWYAAFLSRNDAELACDASTIRRLGESERAEYGRTLLRLTCEKRTDILHTATTMTGSGRSIKERIALIVKKPKMAVYTLIAVLLITAIAIVCTFTGAKDRYHSFTEWTESLTVEDIQWAQASKEYGIEEIYYTVPAEEMDKLRAILCSITEEACSRKQPEGSNDEGYRLALYRADKLWLFKCLSDGTIGLMFNDPETGDFFGCEGSLLVIDSPELWNYIVDSVDEKGVERSDDSTEVDGTTGEQNQLTDEQIRANAIVKNFASLKAEDIKYIPGFTGTDYSDAAVLLNDLEKYLIDPFESDQSFWQLTIFLSGGPEEFSHQTDECMTIYAYGEASRLQLQYHSKLGVTTRVYFDYPALHQYIRKNYHTDSVIDEEALALYSDIVTARAEYTMEVRNSNFDEAKFTDYEIVTFHQIGTFERDGITYEVYELEIAFITENINYPWVMNRVWVDSELRIRSYDSYPYLVVRSDDTKTEHNFFPWDTPLYGSDSEFEAAYDEIAANFIPENSVESTVETLPVLTLTDAENAALCSAAMNNLKTGWWTGVTLADCTYEASAFECVYREISGFMEHFYGYAGYFRFDESGNCVDCWYAPSIVTLDTYTKVAYNVWWPGDGAYYESDILEQFPGEIAEFVAEPNEKRYQVIRDRLLAMAKARMVPVTPSDTETRLTTLVPEDIKYISARTEPSAAEIVDTLRAAMAHRVEYNEIGIDEIFWDFEFFLTGDDPGNSNESVWLKAGLEENIVEIWHRRSYSTAVKLFVEDATLYQLVRDTYHTEPVIDEEGLSRFGDILKDRAQKTVDQSRENLANTPMLPYTGYELVRFEKVDSFQRDGAQYEVYTWDVAFLHDDPTKVVWAGGMWLDSELRVRAVDEKTYFVACISGDTVSHDFFFWDLYFGPDEATGRENAMETIIKQFSDSKN